VRKSAWNLENQLILDSSENRLISIWLSLQFVKPWASAEEVWDFCCRDWHDFLLNIGIVSVNIIR
jgi:hypothetical protein